MIKKETILTKVTENDILKVIAKALGVDESNVTTSTSINDLEEWDSLGHLSILSALDNFFEGKIGSIKELAVVDSVVKIIQILEDNSLLQRKINES